MYKEVFFRKSLQWWHVVQIQVIGAAGRGLWWIQHNFQLGVNSLHPGHSAEGREQVQLSEPQRRQRAVGVEGVPRTRRQRRTWPHHPHWGRGCECHQQ